MFFFSSFHVAYNQERSTFLLLFLLKGLDNAQSLLGYILSTKLSLLFLFLQKEL